MKYKVGDIVEVNYFPEVFTGKVIEVHGYGIFITDEKGKKHLFDANSKNIKHVETHEPEIEEKYVIVADGVTVIPLTYDQAIADAKGYCKAKKSTVTIYKAVAEVVPVVQALVREYKEESPKKSDFTVSIPDVAEPYLTQVRDIISKHFVKNKPCIGANWLITEETLSNNLGSFSYHIDDNKKVVVDDADILLSLDNVGHRVERVKYVSRGSFASIKKDIV